VDAIEAIRGRRSIRAYADRAVPDDLIAAVIEDAAHAPATPLSGASPWTFMVLRGADKIADYGARAKAHARERRPQERGYAWADRKDFTVFLGAPAVILICGAQANPLALEECTRAGQTLAIAAHARGLGSCWVGAPMLWLSDAAVQAELGVPDGCAPYAAFTLGWPAGDPPPAQPRAPPTIVWDEGA
jgi:nitroreductase